MPRMPATHGLRLNFEKMRENETIHVQLTLKNIFLYILSLIHVYVIV